MKKPPGEYAMKEYRNIIEIHRDRCNGCGRCVLDCAEGAIAIIDGKAAVVSDSYCEMMRLVVEIEEFFR